MLLSTGVKHTQSFLTRQLVLEKFLYLQIQYIANIWVESKLSEWLITVVKRREETINYCSSKPPDPTVPVFVRAPRAPLRSCWSRKEVIGPANMQKLVSSVSWVWGLCYEFHIPWRIFAENQALNMERQHKSRKVLSYSKSVKTKVGI